MLEPCTHRRRNDDGITHVVARIYAQIGGHEALEAVVADFYPLSVLGTPRKGLGVRCYFCCLSSSSPRFGAVGPWSGVKVERPQRSEDERP